MLLDFGTNRTPDTVVIHHLMHSARSQPAPIQVCPHVVASTAELESAGEKVTRNVLTTGQFCQEKLPRKIVQTLPGKSVDM